MQNLLPKSAKGRRSGSCEGGQGSVFTRSQTFRYLHSHLAHQYEIELRPKETLTEPEELCRQILPLDE